MNFSKKIIILFTITCIAFFSISCKTAPLRQDLPPDLLLHYNIIKKNWLIINKTVETFHTLNGVTEAADLIITNIDALNLKIQNNYPKQKSLIKKTDIIKNIAQKIKTISKKNNIADVKNQITLWKEYKEYFN